MEFRPLIMGNYVRRNVLKGVFGGGGGQTIGTAPNSQERAVYEVDFQGGGEAGPGKVAGAGETTTTESPRTPPCDITKAKRISAEN